MLAVYAIACSEGVGFTASEQILPLQDAQAEQVALRVAPPVSHTSRMICCCPSSKTDDGEFPLPVSTAEKLLCPSLGSTRGAKGYWQYDRCGRQFVKEYGRMIVATDNHVKDSTRFLRSCEDAGFCLRTTAQDVQNRIRWLTEHCHNRTKALGGMSMKLPVLWMFWATSRQVSGARLAFRRQL